MCYDNVEKYNIDRLIILNLIIILTNKLIELIMQSQWIRF